METMNRPHIILVSSPGIGHIIPMIELSQRLVGDHGVKVTLFAVVSDTPVHSMLQQFLDSENHDLLHVEVIQPEDIDSELPPDHDMPTKIFMTMQESVPLVRSRIGGMEIRPTSLIVDVFGTEFYYIADELGISRYVFMTVSAWATAFFVFSGFMNKKVCIDEVVSTGFLPLPGCAPIRTTDLFQGSLPTSPDFIKLSYLGAMLASADGFLVNSWEALEPTTLNAFRDPDLMGSVVKGAVYPVGPVVREANMSQLDGRMLHWLNEQSDGSVLFISFGSGGSLTHDQTQELALGLEASKHKFLWLLHPPAEKSSSDFYFNAEINVEKDPAAWLPGGFLGRTAEHGLVVLTWAPQLEILSHPSIGGFLSHCGWNSVLESIVNGVPMVTWPLYAEQKQNATMVSEHLKIGVSPSKWPENGIIGRDEVQNMVQMIMDNTDGENSFRIKAKELTLSAANALEKSGNGSSYNATFEFVQVLKGEL